MEVAMRNGVGFFTVVVGAVLGAVACGDTGKPAALGAPDAITVNDPDLTGEMTAPDGSTPPTDGSSPDGTLPPPVMARLPLRQLAEVDLPGRSSRFDYQDLDPGT